jgi:nitrogenase subunit NifH
VPISEEIKIAEARRKTLIEMNPFSNVSAMLVSLAHSIYENRFSAVPKWISADDLECMFLESA